MSIFENDGPECFIDKSECSSKCQAWNSNVNDCEWVLAANKFNAAIDQTGGVLAMLMTDEGQKAVFEMVQNVKRQFNSGESENV